MPKSVDDRETLNGDFKLLVIVCVLWQNCDLTQVQYNTASYSATARKDQHEPN